jgi:hypothetical protein
MQPNATIVDSGDSGAERARLIAGLREARGFAESELARAEASLAARIAAGDITPEERAELEEQAAMARGCFEEGMTELHALEALEEAR